MSGKFLDTNVFVYLFDERDPRKMAVADALVRESLEGNDGVISFQVVQETLHVLLKKALVASSAADADLLLEETPVPLWRVQPSADLYRRALEIQDRYHYGFYDALIIASALAAGCTTLYSEDFQHGQRIDRLTVVNPFLG